MMKNGILCMLALTYICNVAVGQSVIERLPPPGTSARFKYAKTDPTVKETIRGEMTISRTENSTGNDLPCVEVTFKRFCGFAWINGDLKKQTCGFGALWGW